MTEYKIKLTGWQAVVLGIVLALIVGARVLSIGEKQDDPDLLRALESQLATGAELKVESVVASYPLFEFSSSRKVVVKVTYTLKDAAGLANRNTKYYLFRHGMIGNSWQCRYLTTAASYYLNFF